MLGFGFEQIVLLKWAIVGITLKALNDDYGRKMNLEPIGLKPLPDDFELREVQEIATNQTRLTFKNGNKRVTVQLPPGGGKTILTGYMFRLTLEKKPSSQCIFIVPRTTLLYQTKKVFEVLFGFDVGIIKSGEKSNLDRHVQVCTIQTLNNRLMHKKESISNAYKNLPVAMVAIDENHLQFEAFKNIKDLWDPWMIGLSGTPFSKGMGKLWQALVRPKKMIELIEDGTISDYQVKACVPINRTNLRKGSTGEYIEKDVEKETTKIIGDVFNEWSTSEDMRGRRFIGFAPSIATCIALSTLFNDNGANTAFVHSKMNDDAVQSILDAFEAGNYVGVWSVVKLAEGFDDAEVSAIIDCAPLAPSKYDPNIPNSATRYVQKVCRGTRSHPKKDYCLIHDHAMNFMQYGPYESIEDHFTVLDDGSTKPKPMGPEERIKKVVKECPACGMVMKGVHCDICGHLLKKPTQWLEAGDLEFTHGKMIAIKKSSTLANKKKPASREDKIKFSSMLKFKLNKIREKKSTLNIKGMFAHKYKARFGVWPVGDFTFNSVFPREPDQGFNAWYTSQNIKYAKRKKSA